MIEVKANLDLVPGKGRTVRIFLRQFDTIYRFIFTLTVEGEIWNPPPKAEIIMNGVKPDGTIFAYSGEVIEDKAIIDTGVQMTSVPGSVRCVVVILDRDENTWVSTANFILDVEEVPSYRHDSSGRPLIERNIALEAKLAESVENESGEEEQTS